MELAELKEFLKIDGDDHDIVLVGYQLAAEEYLKNAGVAKNYDSALYKITVTIVVGVFLENPSLVSAWKTESDKLGITLIGLVSQLRLNQGG